MSEQEECAVAEAAQTTEQPAEQQPQAPEDVATTVEPTGSGESSDAVAQGEGEAPPPAVQLGHVEDAAPHPGVFRLEAAQGLPEVGADTQTWQHYDPPAGAIRRFKAVDRRTMEVVMLADEGRGLAARAVS